MVHLVKVTFCAVITLDRPQKIFPRNILNTDQLFARILTRTFQESVHLVSDSGFSVCSSLIMPIDGNVCLLHRNHEH